MKTIEQFQKKIKQACNVRFNNTFLGSIVFSLLVCLLLFCEVAMPMYTKICPVCQKEFTKEGWKGFRPKYCSRKCCSKGLAGRKASSSTCEALRTAHKKRVNNFPEKEVARLAKIQKTRQEKWPNGVKLTQRGKDAISKANKGRKMTVEQCENNRQAQLGKVLSEEHKEKISKAAIEHLRDGKCFIQGIHISPKGEGDLYYQSSYELQAYLKLDTQALVKSYRRCWFGISYIKPPENQKRRYFSDVVITFSNGQQALLEIKPDVFTEDPVNLAKWKAARAYCKKKSWEFIVWTEKELGIV